MEHKKQKQEEVTGLFDNQIDPVAVDTPAEMARAWWDLSMDASMWWRRQDVCPRDAAMLLCRMNPLTDDCPESITTDQTGPLDFARLLAAFNDTQRANFQHRSLADWLQIARQETLKYHSWIEEWLASGCLLGAPQTSVNGTESPVTTTKIHRLKTRRDVLDPVLDSAIQEAGCLDLNAVFLVLRRMAINEVLPFTGHIENDALLYTNGNNKVVRLTKEALRQRLKRRAEVLL
jgi:hypothetical protein